MSFTSPLHIFLSNDLGYRKNGKNQEVTSKRAMNWVCSSLADRQLWLRLKRGVLSLIRIC